MSLAAYFHDSISSAFVWPLPSLTGNLMPASRFSSILSHGRRDDYDLDTASIGQIYAAIGFQPITTPMPSCSDDTACYAADGLLHRTIKMDVVIANHKTGEHLVFSSTNTSNSWSYPVPWSDDPSQVGRRYFRPPRHASNLVRRPSPYIRATPANANPGSRHVR